GLEARDGAGQGGLRDADQLRGPGQVLLAGDRDELAKPGHERVEPGGHLVFIHSCMINQQVMHWTKERGSPYRGLRAGHYDAAAGRDRPGGAGPEAAAHRPWDAAGAARAVRRGAGDVRAAVRAAAVAPSARRDIRREPGGG